MINVRLLFPDGKSADGQMHHLPRIGEGVTWTDNQGVTTWRVAHVSHGASNIEIPRKPSVYLRDFTE